MLTTVRGFIRAIWTVIMAITAPQPGNAVLVGTHKLICRTITEEQLEVKSSCFTGLVYDCAVLPSETSTVAAKTSLPPYIFPWFYEGE